MAVTRVGETDIAALAGAAVAITVALFTDDSPFDVYSVGISLTVLLLLWGYVARHKRDWHESAAFAAVTALSVVPIVGWCLEPPTSTDKSQVNETCLALIWGSLAVTAFAADRLYQSKK